MQRHSKLFVASNSTPAAVSGFQGWADLPEALLQSIFSVLGSVRDLLAFAATCHSWRAAFSSYPSKSTLRTLFPPLLIQPNTHVDAPHLPSNNSGRKLRTCKVTDPANRNATLRCQIDEETVQTMYCVGPSYGHLIFCHRGYCLVIDPFSGAEVSPPRLPISDDCEEFSGPEEVPPLHQYGEPYCFGILTAPLASPNSHLLVTNRSSLFDWPVGSDSWSELQLYGAQIKQIVEFNGQFIVMDYKQRIYTLELAPQLGLQEITTNWSGDLTRVLFIPSLLVVCGDKLLMVAYFYIGIPGNGIDSPSIVCKLHHLDMSSKPAKWVEMEVDNWAVFVGGDMRNLPLSCMSPERWGGRSKQLYYARYSPPWSVHGMGNEPGPFTSPIIRYERRCCRKMQPLWVYPSMFYSDGR